MTSDSVPSGAALSTALRTGDPTVLSDLVSAYGDAIYTYGYRRTGSWDAAEQIVQQAFLGAWAGAATAPATDAGLRPWLYRFATDALAGRGDAEALGPDEELPDAFEAAHLSTSDRLRWALRRLAGLPRPLADAWTLSTWERLPETDVAAVLRVPETEVRELLADPRVTPEALGPDELFVPPDAQPVPDAAARNIAFAAATPVPAQARPRWLAPALLVTVAALVLAAVFGARASGRHQQQAQASASAAASASAERATLTKVCTDALGAPATLVLADEASRAGVYTTTDGTAWACSIGASGVSTLQLPREVHAGAAASKALASDGNAADPVTIVVAGPVPAEVTRVVAGPAEAVVAGGYFIGSFQVTDQTEVPRVLAVQLYTADGHISRQLIQGPGSHDPDLPALSASAPCSTGHGTRQAGDREFATKDGLAGIWESAGTVRVCGAGQITAPADGSPIASALFVDDKPGRAIGVAGGTLPDGATGGYLITNHGRIALSVRDGLWLAADPYDDYELGLAPTGVVVQFTGPGHSSTASTAWFDASSYRLDDDWPWLATGDHFRGTCDSSKEVLATSPFGHVIVQQRDATTLNVCADGRVGLTIVTDATASGSSWLSLSASWDPFGSEKRTALYGGGPLPSGVTSIVVRTPHGDVPAALGDGVWAFEYVDQSQQTELPATLPVTITRNAKTERLSVPTR